MRYLRYLTLTEPETYSFDIESIGVFGNSKGGWFTFLGEEVLQSRIVNADDYINDGFNYLIAAPLAAITGKTKEVPRVIG